jgi:hypothetical protein
MSASPFPVPRSSAPLKRSGSSTTSLAKIASEDSVLDQDKKSWRFTHTNFINDTFDLATTLHFMVAKKDTPVRTRGVWVWVWAWCM